MRIEENVALSDRCSLELGGPARFYCEVDREKEVVEAVRWARGQGVPVAILGGGSNVVISDGGIDGLVLRPRLGGIRAHREEDGVVMTAGAGEEWDSLVERSVGEGLYGLECLSGIPGTVGAAPVQNIGAYGQELAEAIRAVRVLDREDLSLKSLDARACRFGYRTSTFRLNPDRFIVLSVTLALSPTPLQGSRHPDILGSWPGRSEPGPAEIRATVLEVRREKSMVIRPADPNRRSVGSFFVNPVVSTEHADAAQEAAIALGTLSPGDSPPFYPVSEREVKVPAAWLIERAGFEKGERRGPVGLSSRHVLALVHHGGGTTRDLLALAAEVRSRVFEAFRIRLEPEPVFLGFSNGDPLGS